MAGEGAGLPRSALLMTRSPAMVSCYAVLRWLGVHAAACPASDGVAGAVRGLVIGDTFVLTGRLCQWQPMRRLYRTVAKRDSN